MAAGSEWIGSAATRIAQTGIGQTRTVVTGGGTGTETGIASVIGSPHPPGRQVRFSLNI